MALNTDRKILRKLEEVRRTGRANMVDKGAVQKVAYDLEMHDLVTWIEDASLEKYVSALDDLAQLELDL